MAKIKKTTLSIRELETSKGGFMMSQVGIEGKEFALMNIFSDDFVFHIPRYQRPYAWTTEHAGVLLADLLSAVNPEEIVDTEKLDPYFLGSIVLIKDDKPDSEVVDGQQRLVTLTILLSVLRHLIPPKKNELDCYIREVGKSLLGIPDRFRLEVRERDRKFFRKFIQEEDGFTKLKDLNELLPDSQQNIRDNAILFLSEIEKIPELERERLAKFILKRCYLVAVWTSDLDSAYRIFSILNDRGLELYHTDILKSEIIGTLLQDQDMYSQKWEELEDDLGREPFKELFAHIRMIYKKIKLRTTILKEFREYVKSKENPKEFIDDILIPMGAIYKNILYANYESHYGADEINYYLAWLNSIDNTDWIPPALLFLKLNKNHPYVLIPFFKDLERLAFGMMIRRANVNERIERYGNLLNAIENKNNLYLEESPLQLTREECIEIINILNGNIYSITRVRKPLLLRLDSILSSGEASYNYPIITIEHVLPLNPPEGSKWLEWFPEQELRDQYVNKLCNLVLLSSSKNSSASNFDFTKKKNQYFTKGGVSPFALTTQVLMNEEWTPEILDKRQGQLLNILKENWRL